MGLIQDVGGKMLRSFLSLDDLVLGKSVVAESVSQIGLTGRSLAGSLVVGSNVAVRTVHAGLQMGTKTAKLTAGALEGLVPGAAVAKTLATRLDDEVSAAAEEASQLASHALEMVGGGVPRNPLTNEEWLGKSAPRGYGWGELAADTTVGSFGRLAAMPLSLGVESIMRLASTGPGQAAVASALSGVDRLLQLVPGSNSTDFDTAELRETLMAVATATGDAALNNVVDLAEAASRLALGDTRKLKTAIEEAVARAQLLAGHAEFGELWEAIPISETLRDRARSLVDHAPKKLLEALERGPNGEAPSAGRVLAAMFDDANNLLVFATEYPLILALMGTNGAAFLTAAMLDVSRIQDYVQDHGAADAERPRSAAQLEAYVGKAPASAFFEPTVHAAQDTAFIYSSEILGRGKALERMRRLYGRDVSERLECDLSLDLDVLRAEPGSERDGMIRDHILATTDEAELRRQRERCQRQLASLDAFTRSLREYQPKSVAERKKILRTFLSLVNQDLALRGSAVTELSERSESRGRFDAWLDSAVG